MKQKNLSVLLILFALLSSIATLQAAEKFTRIPGTHFSMIPPQGFVVSDQFAGFTRPDTGTSIIVVEMKAPFSETSKAFTSKEAVEKNNMTYLGHEDIFYCGRDSILAKVQQKKNGAGYTKLILMSGNKAHTLMLMTTIPDRFAPQLLPVLRKSMLESRWNIEKEIDPFDGLPYTVDLKQGFTPCMTISKSIILTPEGVQLDKTPDKALYMVVATGIADSTTPGAVEKFIQTNIPALTKVAQYQTTQTNRIKINGFEVHSLQIQYNKDGVPMYALVTFYIEGNNCYVMLGSCSQSGTTKYAPVFQSLTESFRVKAQ